MEKEYIISIFVTIITIVDPLGLLPVYLPLVDGLSFKERKKIVLKAFLYALTISLVFLILGRPLFHYLAIDFSAVYIVGGILLFKVGLEMILSNPHRKEEVSHLSGQNLYKSHHDIAVYPLAIPLLSGPGTIAAIIMFSSKSVSLENYLLIFLAFTVAYALASLTMLFGGRIVKTVGPTGLNITERIMGIILCSLAVQFLINATIQTVKSHFPTLFM